MCLERNKCSRCHHQRRRRPRTPFLAPGSRCHHHRLWGAQCRGCHEQDHQGQEDNCLGLHLADGRMNGKRGTCIPCRRSNESANCKLQPQLRSLSSSSSIVCTLDPPGNFRCCAVSKEPSSQRNQQLTVWLGLQPRVSLGLPRVCCVWLGLPRVCCVWYYNPGPKWAT